MDHSSTEGQNRRTRSMSRNLSVQQFSPSLKADEQLQKDVSQYHQEHSDTVNAISNQSTKRKHVDAVVNNMPVPEKESKSKVTTTQPVQKKTKTSIVCEKCVCSKCISNYPRIWEEVFEFIESCTQDTKFDMAKGLLEIYNAKIDTQLILNLLKQTSYNEKVLTFLVKTVCQNYSNSEAAKTKPMLYEWSEVVIYAAKMRKLKTLSILFKNGVDINGRINDQNQTLLMEATKGCNSYITQRILEKGADLNLQDEDGDTAVSWASHRNNFYAFCFLIKAGADVNLESWIEDSGGPTSDDYKGFTLLSLNLAQLKHRPRLKYIRFLLKRDAKVPSGNSMFVVHYCIAVRRFDILRFLIKKGGFSPTILNIKSNYCLLQPSYREKFAKILSPLCMALLCGQVTIAKEMQRAGYLTFSDFFLLSKNKHLIKFLEYYRVPRSLKFVEDLAQTVPTLSQLSFARVSDLVGPQPGRKHRTENLGLPRKLQKELMFSCDHQTIGDRKSPLLDQAEVTADLTLAAEKVVFMFMEHQGMSVSWQSSRDEFLENEDYDSDDEIYWN